MTSSSGSIFHVTGPLWGEFTGHRWIPLTIPVTWSFDVIFDLGMNKRLSKQSRHRWFESPSCCNITSVGIPIVGANKTILCPLHNWISYIGKVASWYWIRAQGINKAGTEYFTNKTTNCHHGPGMDDFMNAIQTS